MEIDGIDSSPFTLGATSDIHQEYGSDGGGGGNDILVPDEEKPKLSIYISHRHKLIELLKNLHSPEIKIYSEASKEFIALLVGDSGGDFLREYVEASPKCAELAEAWKLHHEKPGVAHVLSLISAVLDHPEGKSRAGGIRRSLDGFARSVLESRLEDIYDELKSNESRRQCAALSLLASIVRRGTGAASEVAKNFDFKLPVLSKFSGVQKKSKGGKTSSRGTRRSTRRAFVRFAVSFIEAGNPRLLRWVLQQRDMYSGVLRALGGDDVDTVVHVLSTLRDKVLTEDSLVPPPLRSVLFGSAALEQLNYISGNPEAGLGAELAHEVLVRVCTNPCNGLMPGRDLKGNEKRLFELMKKLKATEVRYHRDLLLAIVNGRPSLCSAYMDEYPYHLEPRPSSVWFAAISLAADMISSINADTAIETIAYHSNNPPEVNSGELQNILKCIIPRAFTRSVINKGLLHSDTLVKHGSLRLLLESVKSLGNLISSVEGVIKKLQKEKAVKLNGGGMPKLHGLPGFSCFESVDRCLGISGDGSSHTEIIHVEKWVFLKQYIQDEVRALLPDPQVLLKLLSLSRTNLKRHSDLPEFGLKKLKSDASTVGVDIVISGMESNPTDDAPNDWKLPRFLFTKHELDGEQDQAMTIGDIWGLDDRTGMANESKDVENFFQSKLLDVLTFYMGSIPVSFEGSFDFFKILPVNPLSLSIDQQRSLLSLLVEYIGQPSGSRVSARVPELMYRNLQPLINFLLYSQDKNIQHLAYILARAAMISSGAFDQNISEIDAWFLFLPGYNLEVPSMEDQGAKAFHEYSAVVVSFLSVAVSTVGNNLYKYLDNLRKLISKLDNIEDDSSGFSPLIICILQKCIRLLESDSESFKLHEKTMISSYVCNTLSIILQTQVDTKLLPGLIYLFLMENLKEADSKCSLCEWKPLMNLLFFARDILHQQSVSLFSAEEYCLRGDGRSLFPILMKIKEFLVHNHDEGELVGVSIAFSSSIICATTEDILANLPLLLSIAQLHFKPQLSYLSSLVFLGRMFLVKVADLWPDMFSGLEAPKIASIINSEHLRNTIEDIDCTSLSVCTENMDSTRSAAGAFSLFLKHTHFYSLFSAFLVFGSSESHLIRMRYTMSSTKVLDLLRAKLSEVSIDDLISSFRFVLFWAYQILLSYRAKPSTLLEELFQMCFTLVEYIFEHIFVAAPDGTGYETSGVSSLTTVIDIICHHPLATLSVSHSLCCGKKPENENLEDNAEAFLASAKQNFHPMNHKILQFLRKVFQRASAVGNGTVALRHLGQMSLFLLREKFDLHVMVGDLEPFSHSFYTFHILMDSLSPFELLELVLWMFCELEGKVSGSEPVFLSALSAGLYIADAAIAMLSSFDRNKKVESYFFWDMKVRSFDIAILYKVFCKILDFSTYCRLELLDICLLKFVNAVFDHQFSKSIPSLLPLYMLLHRMIINSPVKMLSYFIYPTSLIKANALLLLTEVSPLHLRLFGHTFMNIIDKKLPMVDGSSVCGTGKLQRKLIDDNCNYVLSEDEFVFLLPAALSYLNFSFNNCIRQNRSLLEKIPIFYSGLLLDGFSDWKNYVSRSHFQEEYPDLVSVSFEDFEKIFTNSLLGRAVSMLRYFFILSGSSLKKKQRLKTFNALYPGSSMTAELLDCDLKEFSGSYKESLKRTNEIIGKMSFTMLLLGLPDRQTKLLAMEEGTIETTRETDSNKMNCAKLRFINILVNTLDLIVRRFPLEKGSTVTSSTADSFHVFRFLEYSILRKIIQLSLDIKRYIIQLPSIPFMSLFIRSSLLYRIGDPITLNAIRRVLIVLSEGKYSCTEVLELLLGHSQFVHMVLSNDSVSSSTFTTGGALLQPLPSILKLLDFATHQQTPRGSICGGSSESRCNQCAGGRKLELIRLLRALYHLKGRQQNTGDENTDCMNLRELHSLLLSGYGATLSETDLEILNLMDELELIDGSENGGIAEFDYLWGNSALKSRDELMHDTLRASKRVSDAETIEERHKMLFRENIPVDSKLCAMTILHFPYDRSSRTGPLSLERLLQDNLIDNSLLTHHIKPSLDNEGVYDPTFILRFSIHSLLNGYIDPVEFSRLGLLGVTFVSISSPDDKLRKLGYESLGTFKKALENYRDSKEMLQLQLLLTYIQNGITEPWQKLPSIICIFAAEASFILLDPQHEHFLTISKVMMHSPTVSLKDVPLFNKLFASGSVHFKKDRLWILRLLYLGLNFDDDADIYMNKELPELLFSFCSSSIADSELKIWILQIVKRSVRFHKFAEHLVQHCGLIPWLSSILTFYGERLMGDDKYFTMKSMELVLKIMNDVTLLKTITQWLEDLALEQLSEFSTHLHKLFIGSLDLLKEDISLVNSILHVMLSTLEISQKRKICLPHFTLSLQGIFQLYKTLNDMFGDSSSLTSELLINIILMNAPMPVITYVDRSRLSKLLIWAVSSTLWSCPTQRPVGKEPNTDLPISLKYQEREENLVSKMLRWITASVILGSISKRFSKINVYCTSKRLEQESIQHLLEGVMNEMDDGEENDSEANESLAVVILHLQQLLRRKCNGLPSVISALCLLLHSTASNATGKEFLNENHGLIASLCSKIRCPVEVNPAWRWSFYQRWEDPSLDLTEMELMEEEHACQELLVIFSNALEGKAVGFSGLTHQDLQQSGLFEWERQTLLSSRTRDQGEKTGD